MQRFDYHVPESLDAVGELLDRAEDSKLLAGGMTLLPTMKQRLAQPSDLIDLRRIPDLAGISAEGQGLRIGAMTRHVDVERSPLVARLAPALGKLAGVIGDPQVRNRGTIGGSVANADPAADYPAGVLGLGATIRTSRRDIPSDGFFVSMFETALEPGEIITSFYFPRSPKAAYVKFRNQISGYAVVGVMVAKTEAEVRVAVTGAGPSAFRWADAERALALDFTRGGLAGVVADAGELNDDMHASAEYRAHLMGVMTRRAVAALAAEA